MTDGKNPDNSNHGRRAGVALLVAIVATAVFAVFPAPSGWDVYAVRFAGMLLAASVWVVVALLGGLRAPDRTDRAWLAALSGFGIVVVLATAFGYAPAEMLTFGNGYYGGALTWIVWLLIASLASLARPSDRMRRGLLIAQVPVGILSAVAILDGIRSSSYISGFENRNHLVPGLILAVPIALGLAHASSDRRWRIASLVSAALAAVAIVLARSTAGVLGLAVAILLSLIFAPELLGAAEPRQRRQLRTAGVVCSAVLIVLLAVALVAPGLAGSVGLGSAREQLVGEALSSRLFYWKAAVSTATSRPLLGVGADGFEVAAQRLVDASEGAQAVLQGVRDWAPIAGDAHNLVLTVFVCFGVVGLAVAGAVAVTWGLSMRRLWQRGMWSGLRAAFAIAILSWFAAMLFVPLSVQWGGYVAMMFGLAVARGSHADRLEFRKGVGVAARYLGYLVVTGLVLFAASVMLGNYWFWTADAGTGNDVYFSRIAKARAAQPTMSYYRFVQLDSQGDALSGAQEDLAKYHDAVDGSGSAITEDVRYMTVLVRKSLDEAYLTGRSDLSWEEHTLARLSSQAPALPELIMERAHLALLKGDAQSALELLLEVKPFETSLPRTALYRLYYARLKGNSEAEEQMLAIVTRQGVPERLYSK